jgi:hypothetical protein
LEFEIFAHIINHCLPAMQNITKRRNDIVRRIKTQVGNPKTGCELIYEDQPIPAAEGRKRPNLVIQKGNNVYVVDVTDPL